MKIKQGDPMPANIVNCVLEKIFRKLDWNGERIKVRGAI